MDLHDNINEILGLSEAGIRELYLAYAEPFFLDVGGGLKPYRQAFIKRLQQEPPERAEYLWGLVHKAMTWWERQDAIPPNIAHSFPATFKAAQAYYLPPKQPVKR